MREATGQASLMNIMLTIIGVIILLLAGSIAYSKAFRVKNKIIDIIEKNNVYDGDARIIIDEALLDIGYRLRDSSISMTEMCHSNDGYTLIQSWQSNYLYCVYKSNNSTSEEYYYKVVTFMYFDLPVIGSYIRIPVSGETKILYRDSDWKTVD